MTTRVAVTGPTVGRVDPSAVAAALGGEVADGATPRAVGPLTRYAVRGELLKLRPSADDSREGGRVNLSRGEADWTQLEALAAALQADGVISSASQIAGALLNLALRSATADSGRPLLVSVRHELTGHAGSPSA